MISRTAQNEVVYRMLKDFIRRIVLTLLLVIDHLESVKQNKRRRLNPPARYRMIERILALVNYVNRLVFVTDKKCVDNFRMDRNAYARLCSILRDLGGLTDSKYVPVEEQVAMFLRVLAHHEKNVIVSSNFWRSGQTVSHYVHLVLTGILKIHHLFFVSPTPVPEDCDDPRWSWFKGCLRALDGTLLNVFVLKGAKPRYRSRKGDICSNVLGVVDRNMQWIYVLPGWEGSAADARVLRDAVTRPHGLKIPHGNYYLCDNGYANSEGFLSPYKCVRYHLQEWGVGRARPCTYQELFNMRHAKARNIVERAFGVMNKRWSVWRSCTFYPIQTQVRLIMASFIVHNFIRREMAIDPAEVDYDAQLRQDGDTIVDEVVEEDYIANTESSAEWNMFRDELAQSMWTAYVGN